MSSFGESFPSGAAPKDITDQVGRDGIRVAAAAQSEVEAATDINASAHYFHTRFEEVT